MSDIKLKAAVLIVSDTAAKDPLTDKAGDTLKETFAADGGGRWDEPQTTIVPDNVLDIQRTIQGWTDTEQYVNLVVTTGGTGFTPKDNTPEVRGFPIFFSF